MEKNNPLPQGCFIEDLDTNLSLLRKRIVSSRLKFKLVPARARETGELTPGKVVIVYIEGTVQPELLQSLAVRMEALDLDGIIGTGQIERLTKDFPWSPFPQFLATKRIDKAVTALLAGKLLVMLNGDPVTMIAPATFFDFFQEPDDLNVNWLFGTFIRWLRLLAVGIAIFLPALYVAVMAFHYYIIPVNFLAVLAESRVPVPFPPVIEVLLIEIVAELLRELTSRLSNHIGVTIGVTGGVLLGLAAVTTGTISGFLVIVSMVTLIASLILPTYDLGLSTRVLKFVAIFFAAVFGVLGLVVTASVIFAHLVTMESLGRPYFQPVIPFRPAGFKDIFIKPPTRILREVTAQPQSPERREDN